MKIKSVKEMFYKGIENQGKVEKGEYTGSQERLYNEQGNLLKETYYYPQRNYHCGIYQRILLKTT
ncbi:hypothetical protein [Capnocytophaga cynodegmi]|uniref:hypothetical protein n=1 Tax=Capnocytophaga cynodegmi TaxID=28189 RepID=UPI0037CFE37F